MKEHVEIGNFNNGEEISDVNYHPVLPSLDNAEINYKAVTSDHVPILTYINGTRIISWNVLENDYGNGFGLLKHEGKIYGETIEQREDRHIRIAESIASFIRETGPIHFIALQEITERFDDDLLNTSLLYHILKRLPQGWELPLESIGKVGDQSGVITLFNSNFYELPKEGYTKSYPDLAGNLTKFKKKGKDDYVEILNVHSDYNLIPLIMKKK
ncbi:MAG: hypothetical protein H0U73_13655 [Tatlockia sp.]|nr:hypothetical protein [Tatlockia sp.]